MNASETLLLAALRTQKRQPPLSDTLVMAAEEVARVSDAGADFKTLATSACDIKTQKTLVIFVSSEQVDATVAELRSWLEQKLAGLATSAARDGNTFRIYCVAENASEGRCFFFELTKSAFSTRCLLWKSSRPESAVDVAFTVLPSALLELAGRGKTLTLYLIKAAKPEPAAVTTTTD